MTDSPIFFYPHSYFRDRHLDTIRNWPSEQVLNPEIAEQRRGAQVSRKNSLEKNGGLGWKQILPLPNVKFRPKGIPEDAVVYVWGGIILNGPFIIELDNPYALTGYNPPALSFYRPFFRKVLLGDRCREIRCLSKACRETLGILFGKSVYERARVFYPSMKKKLKKVQENEGLGCRFLFVGTQFELKGGPAMLRAFRRVYNEEPAASLDVVTHLPEKFKALAGDCPGIRVHEANFTRDEISSRFLMKSDVLVHPTYIESFGMTVLEAIAHGLAVIASDVYALGEMVLDGENGFLIKPPVSAWNHYLPSPYFRRWWEIKQAVEKKDTVEFEKKISSAMLVLIHEKKKLERFKNKSLELIGKRFEGGSGENG